MNKELLSAVTNRFLGWKLPTTFGPDCFVSFDRERAQKNQSWPIGTNLFTYEEAKAMFEYAMKPVSDELTTVQNLLANLVAQVNKFCAENGEADFFTGPHAQYLRNAGLAPIVIEGEYEAPEMGGREEAWRLQSDVIVKQDGGLVRPQRFLKAGTMIVPPPHPNMQTWGGRKVFWPIEPTETHRVNENVDVGKRAARMDCVHPAGAALDAAGFGPGSEEETSTFHGRTGIADECSAHEASTKKWAYPMRDTHETDKAYAQRCKQEHAEWFKAHGLPAIVAWAHDGEGRLDVCNALIKQLLVNAGLAKQVEHYTIPLVRLDADAYLKAQWADYIAKTPPDIEYLRTKFNHIWAEMQRRGFQYGPGALEHVWLGFQLANGLLPKGRT